ncbi:hypothetical protein NZ47_03820 [Anaerovibrio lipolyticus]|uniref:Uncharacterized protein n=1 Tax=Anaerovibrio lipolyticus TaxID=82374 RepID=A0A0B2K1D9_9FIRM|nr:hypothetical protein [Anaerovibrio lipolyticus]KHM52616.1 hypothetical protein NZ47_03820 [Anaerovibrio lipolyticus]
MVDLKTVDTKKYLNEGLPVELEEVIEEFYTQIKENNPVGLWSKYERIYYEAKDSWKFEEISMEKMREIQRYFRGIVNG